MFKLYAWIFVGIIFTVGLFSGEAKASGTGACEAIAQNPTVTGAENYLIAAAEIVVEYNIDTEAAGKEIAYDIVNRCPQYVNVVLQAAENLGG